jgi:hypothetical protein
MAVSYPPQAPERRSVPHSAAVAASLLTSTNGNALIQLTNSGGTTYRVVSCRIHSRGVSSDPVGHVSAQYRIGGFPTLLTATSTKLTLWVVPKAGSWRAEVIVANDATFFPALGKYFGERSAWTEWTNPGGPRHEQEAYSLRPLCTARLRRCRRCTPLLEAGEPSNIF